MFQFCFCFMFCFFAREACGISDSHPGIYPGKVLITRSRGKSLKRILKEHEIALLPQVLKLNKCAYSPMIFQTLSNVGESSVSLLQYCTWEKYLLIFTTQYFGTASGLTAQRKLPPWLTTHLLVGPSDQGCFHTEKPTGSRPAESARGEGLVFLRNALCVTVRKPVWSLQTVGFLRKIIKEEKQSRRKGVRRYKCHWA